MALDAHIVFEMQTGGSNNNGGGCRWVSLVNSTYKWTASGSGTNEYYCELAGGGDPSLTEPDDVTTDGTYKLDTNGTLGSLNAGEWDWGDNDSLGYSTVYVRLDDGADPDTKNDKWVSMVFGGGQDLSQTTSAALNPTDLAMVQSSTTLTSATGGFTAAMVGNVIQITAGTNFDTGWYEITVYTDTNTVTLDRTAASGGNGSSGTGYVGGCMALPVDAFYEAWTAGNKCYMKAGTYTFTESPSIVNTGSASAFLVIEGYNTLRGDNPTGDNRPLCAVGANSFQFNEFFKIINVRFTGTNTFVLRTDGNSAIINCKANNSSGTANRSAFYIVDDVGLIYDSEGISANGEGLEIASAGNRLVISHCYFHDSDTGMNIDSVYVRVMFCILDTCASDGINYSNSIYSFVINCTFYNCTTAALTTSSTSNVLWYNNQFVSCGIGINESAALREDSLCDYNNYYDNTTNYGHNSLAGINDTANNPGFTDAAGGDFSGVDSADGLTIRLGVG